MIVRGEWVSANRGPRPRAVPIDMLVLHYTGMETAEAALARLCDPASRVSAHYVVEEDGTVHGLVDERFRAWHAGESFWRGHADINGRSIGIELVNPGHEFGYRHFPEDQMAALIDLARDILARHPIPPRNIVGHADVAPRRKRDPGELFDWARLAAAGIGLWPGEAPPKTADDERVRALLADYGYETVDPTATILAFQRHFRAFRVTGSADAETVGRLVALAAMAN
jgi:N-acetylmuramoyl-L-alanine amidase